MKRHWLIAAFEPFAGRKENNSEAVMNEMLKLAIENEKNTEKNSEKNSAEWPFQFHYKVLPCEYDRCFDAVMDEMKRLEAVGVKFEGILALGEGAEDFKIEMQANNLDDVDGFPDNAGISRSRKKIFKDLDAEDVILLNFPFDAFPRIRKSMNAGYFVCNHLCAKLGRHFGRGPAAPFVGFIHVPRVGQGGVFTADVCASLIVNGFRKIHPQTGTAKIINIGSAAANA